VIARRRVVIFAADFEFVGWVSDRLQDWQANLTRKVLDGDGVTVNDRHRVRKINDFTHVSYAQSHSPYNKMRGEVRRGSRMAAAVRDLRDLAVLTTRLIGQMTTSSQGC
jgi:hypothetical protein